MAIIVEVVNTSGSPIITTRNQGVAVVEAVSPVEITGPIGTSNNTAAVVEVVGPGKVANAVVSATPPSNPYEGQIWIDIS